MNRCAADATVTGPIFVPIVVRVYIAAWGCEAGFSGRGAYRACVETRFSWLEIKRDHDPLQSSGVSIFAESPVRESAELAFLI